MTDRPSVVIVAAVSKNGVIGRDGDMPWRLSSDLKRFKKLTLNSPVVMGRKTFQSIGKPLPDRLNITVSRDPYWSPDGALRAGSLDAAIEIATTHLRGGEGQEVPAAPLPHEIFVIGGGDIYAQALGIADRLCITHVLAEIDGDTRFPEIDPDVWEELSSEDIPAGEKDSHPTRYVVYERRK